MRIEHDWFPADIPANADIGKDVYIDSAFAFEHYRSEQPCGFRLGNYSSTTPGTAFHLGPRAALEIGQFSIMNGTVFALNSRCVVGNYCMLSGEAYITDMPFAVPPRDAAFGEMSYPDSGETTIVIEDDCWLGVRVVLLAGTRLGRGVIVGAGSVIDFEVPPFAIVAGNPARIVGSSR